MHFPNELIRDLILARNENPAGFAWTVNVRAGEYERGIQRRKVILDSQLSEKQRKEQDTLNADASEATIKEFSDVCPPFRAFIYRMLLSWYDLAVRDRHAGQKFRAGRNDMFMSVYLPYCDKFVNVDANGEQEKCLREVVAVAGLETQILSYDNFCDSFLVTT